MKISKIILPLLFAFAILSFSFKSNQNSNKIEVLLEKIDTEKLCKTWYIVSGIVKAEGEEEELPEDMINGKFIFHKTSRYQWWNQELMSQKMGLGKIKMANYI